MNLVVPPNLNHADRPSEDEVDGLLRAFYKAEMPDPWPSLEAPVDRNLILPLRPAARRFPMLRTRLALAACVAFLVAGPIALSAYFNRANTTTAAQTTTPSGDAVSGSQMDPNVRITTGLQQGPGGTAVKVEANDAPKK